MRVHHLNCVSGCPLGGLIMDGSSLSLRGRLTSHCLLIEAADALVLVDTGYGLRDVADPRSRLHPFFRAHDVRHIVLSHLDFDHAGGLDDFPEANVHMMRAEERSATAQATPLDRMRYRPQQWGNRDRWRTYEADRGETWQGFSCVRELSGLDAEIALVPLVGHTLGHAGVAVRRPDDWLLYAADAYFYHEEMHPERPRCTPGLALYQTMMEKDRGQRLGNQARLRALARQHQDITVFCAHDVTEFERLSGQSHRSPVASATTLDRRLSPTPA